MPVGRIILVGLLGLVVAETAVFLTVAWLVGTAIAVLLLAVPAAVGIAILLRMGRRLAGRIADILSQSDFAAAGTRPSGLLTTLAALLLLLPGFLTDLVGLALLIPAVQMRLIAAAPLGRQRPSGRVLELDRGQWHDLPERQIDQKRGDIPKVPPKRAKAC